MVSCDNEDEILATYSVDKREITAVIKKENIYGLQFHPENSGKEGLAFIENFCNE